VVACAGGDDAFVEHWLNERGISYFALPLDRTGINPLMDFIYLLKLIFLLRQIRPRIVFGYTIKPIVYGLLGARFVGVSDRYALITGLGSTFFSGSTFKQRIAGKVVPLLYRLALQKCTKVFFQNDDDLREFRSRQLLSDSIPAVSVNGSGIDLEEYVPVPMPEDDIVFLLIARLLNDKGIREYVEAARIVKQEFSKTRFQLLGPNDKNIYALKQEEMETWISEGVIEYLGETDDVRPFIEAATVFVLPSYREGIPRSVLEAMAMARPIITTDTPGCRETVIPDRNGYLVPARDAKSLSDVMRRFIYNPGLAEKMGKESRRLAEEKFDVNKVNKVLIEAMKL